MRLTLLNQFYRPDVSPTAHLSASLAEHRAAGGDRVTVVTSRGKYVAPGAAAAAHSIGRVKANPLVLRGWTPNLGKASLARRLLDYGSFYATAVWTLLALPRQDVVVSLTTPPYIALAGVLHKLVHRRAKLVLWNMDCYPDVVERAGIIRRCGVVSLTLRWLNRLLFRRVDHLVCLDTAMAELLLSQYGPRGPRRLPVTLIPNWEDLALFPPNASPPAWPEAAALGLDGKFVVLYLGNTGVGHAFETALDAAEMLRDDDRVRFVFIGGGSRWKELEAARRDRGLRNLVLRGYVAKELTPSVMASAAVSLITLRDDALGVMSPSKLHANLAAGLPVAYVGPAGSNVDDAIRRFDCGASVRHGDAAGLVGFVRELSSDPTRHAELRRRARAAFDAAYCDARTLPQFDGVLDGLVPVGGGVARR